MSPRNEFRTSTALFMGVAVTIGMVMVLTESHWLVVAFVPWILVGSYLMSRVRCPRCKKSVTFKGRVFGLEYHAGYASKHCKNCGYDLTLPREV